MAETNILKNKKIIGIILIIIALITASLLIWRYELKVKEDSHVKTTSFSGPADWQTYSNNNYGFSFRYPTNWKIEKADVKSFNGTVLEQLNFTGSSTFKVKIVDVNKFAASQKKGSFDKNSLESYIKYTQGESGIITLKENGLDFILMTKIFTDEDETFVSEGKFIKQGKYVLEFYSDFNQKDTDTNLNTNNIFNSIQLSSPANFLQKIFTQN
ncbi:TPA: hypothetical protein DD449_02145 [Candidatus Berkelbacteria bacterium]|uniref:PsbP C-terminal domain-containing protein n=1 Tax=Berkelbacteria bacterium GW2011_GWE1_39_12 TaxID=1618337 RepID=A0A0G4B392_9BACT|nr:MAG: hypothetical protein UT28_C0001G0069 [Berkelbacteria bacterium GW2011_GWE1_39_12]HBO60460.1 hypothetical protein [Candidatus Berkelbacteria bacterium]